MFSESRFNEVITNCQALVREKSYSGEEGNVVNVIKSMMEEYEFDDIHIDRYGNIIGGIVGKYP
ncbi:hypothetical protein, partial [Pseudomonas aeruginosa]